MSSQVASQDPPPQALSEAESAPLLTWQVHLARRYPQRLSILMVTLLLASGCVWMVFHHPLPVITAICLLLGSVREYLFPITYRITGEEVSAQGIGMRAILPWKAVRRCLPERSAITLTPLASASRMDVFRGITLRYATKGTPGDRASVLETIARCAPALLPASETRNADAFSASGIAAPPSAAIAAEERCMDQGEDA